MKPGTYGTRKQFATWCHEKLSANLQFWNFLPLKILHIQILLLLRKKKHNRPERTLKQPDDKGACLSEALDL